MLSAQGSRAQSVQNASAPLFFSPECNGRDYARSAVISNLWEVSIRFYIEVWVDNSPNIILQSNMERFSRIIRSAQGQNVDFGRWGGGAMPRPGNVWRSRQTDMLVGPPYSMYEMLELSWMYLCKTQV